MLTQLVTDLCGGFTVTRTGIDEPAAVVDPHPECANVPFVAEGKRPLGCCCLCLLANSPNTWTVRLTENTTARTGESAREIVVPPTNSANESGHWTAKNVRVMRPRVMTFAHELCGHAAMFELKAHPDQPGRQKSDEHDPAIRMERGIWLEQGRKASEMRALTREGPHRGESFNRITTIKFPFGGANVADLPAAEFAKLQFAADLIMKTDRWVEIVGHSDPVGTAAARQTVSNDRARNVRDKLLQLGMKDDSPKRGVGAETRVQRVEGVSDREPLTGEPHEKWRRVEIFTTGFPAGLTSPPKGTPSAVDPIAPPPSAKTSFEQGNACVKLLINTAWGGILK
jgi:outer membrane protein OmpA-like peptidoglycan-associated protein